MLLSDDEKVIDQARFLATQARDRAPHYEHSRIGYNYRMNDITGAIGLPKLDRLQQETDHRRAAGAGVALDRADGLSARRLVHL